MKASGVFVVGCMCCGLPVRTRLLASVLCLRCVRATYQRGVA